MNSISIFGMVIIALGCMALISSSSTQLKGDREYTFKSGFVMTVIGFVLLVLGMLGMGCF